MLKFFELCEQYENRRQLLFMPLTSFIKYFIVVQQVFVTAFYSND